jgi:hypothetical protein
MRRNYARQTEEYVEGDVEHLEVLTKYTLRCRGRKAIKSTNQISRAPGSYSHRDAPKFKSGRQHSHNLLCARLQPLQSPRYNYVKHFI